MRPGFIYNASYHASCAKYSRPSVSPRVCRYLFSNIYCKMRWKKNVNLDHLISRAWHFIRQRKGASRGTSWKRGAGEPYPTPPVKTLTHESDGTWVATLEVSRAKFTSIYTRSFVQESFERVPALTCPSSHNLSSRQLLCSGETFPFFKHYISRPAVWSARKPHPFAPSSGFHLPLISVCTPRHSDPDVTSSYIALLYKLEHSPFHACKNRRTYGV